jgi:hypothetical protein
MSWQTGSRLAAALKLPNPQRLPNKSGPCGAGVSLHALSELAAELSRRPVVRHAGSRHPQSQHRTDCKAGVYACRDALMFDQVQAPSLQYALELVKSTIHEADS